MKLVAVATMVIAIFVGISHVGSDKADPSKLVINSTGFNNAFADSLGWQGVRSFATLIRAASQTFNTLYNSIRRWGLLLNYSIDLNGPIVGTDY